ncbi:MAG TPA: cytochrome c biogenesis protein CcdA [Patescibacteria group bacterium]|nr:cytochrome c biogenesis protein CcdA [Patescibacteria group bacterium]
MSKKFIILAGLALLILVLAVGFKTSDFSTSLVWQLSNGGQWLLPLVIVASLIDSINPCAFSVLLLTIAFLFSLGKLREKILVIGSFYILGLFAVYLAIGLSILQVLHLFNTPHFMARLGAFLLIILGVINLIGHFWPSFPIKFRISAKFHRPMAQLMEKGSLPAAFALGVLVGLCEFPCTGGPYLMVLGLLHDQSTYLKGLAYLIFYNLIFILPLVIILILASEKSLMEKVDNWRRVETGKMKIYSGLAMIILGILIFFL